MGFYTKRIFTVENDSTPEKVKKLADAFEKCTGFNLFVADDHCDDSNWNDGCGISNGPFGQEYEAIGEAFGEDFKVHCVDETGAIYDVFVHVYYDDGNRYYAHAEDDVIRNSPQWYEDNKDAWKENPGARRGYFTDYGPGEDYPVLYGNEHIPAGVEWWKLPENQFYYGDNLKKINIPIGF